MTRATILVVDDEKDVVELVRYNLEREGYRIVGASSGETALAAARNELPDVVLLDRSLPGLDGIEICRRLRRSEPTAHVPIILVTARVTEEDRVAGLEAGADDYMTKPFSPRELVARVRAHLRRAVLRPSSTEVHEVGHLVLDVGKHRVTYSGQPVSLTAGEFRILRFLAMRPGRVFSRSEIIEGALEGSVDSVSRTIDVHLASIRRKLGRGGGMIETIRGVGYRLAEGTPRPSSREGRG